MQLEQTKDLSLLDLQQILLGMRRQRLGLIQTPDQLRFSYIAILQGALNDLGLENTTFDLEDSEEDSVEESESKSVNLVAVLGYILVGQALLIVL